MDELKRLAIDLIKQIAEFDPTELVVNSAELMAGKIEHDEELIIFHSKRSGRIKIICNKRIKSSAKTNTTELYLGVSKYRKNENYSSKFHG